MEKYSVNEMCEKLRISKVTGYNWIRAGRITPQFEVNGEQYFSEEYIEELIRNISTRDNTTLKARRNKLYVKGNALYNGYISKTSPNTETVAEIVNFIKAGDIGLSKDGLKCMLAYCARSMFREKEMEAASCERLVEDLADRRSVEEFVRANPWIESFKLIYEKGEDTLGFLYISCREHGERKTMGAYYTPDRTVKKLVHQLNEYQSEGNELSELKVLDPCCGTGNFLLQLTDDYDIDKLYANDIDEIGVKITRINLALRYNIADEDFLYRHVTQLDFLNEYNEKDFDVIIGNPPWGGYYTAEDKENLRRFFRVAKGNSVESYDLFVEKALSLLKESGRLSFVLPEAILNVQSHMAVRQLILEIAGIEWIGFIDEHFNRIQCPAIIMQMRKTVGEKASVCVAVENGDNIVEIKEKKRLMPEGFMVKHTEWQYKLYDKIMSCPNNFTLKGNADFAMGIVTGNNSKFLFEEMACGMEPIYRGRDMEGYSIGDSGIYIKYEPARFQQCALEKYYRAPEKLVYRFVSDRFVFAYDDKQRLTLNSCNIVIPRVQGVSMKYIMAVLNSDVANFILKVRFGTKKILRQHIEFIPIPMIEHKMQQDIVRDVEKLEEMISELPELLEDKRKPLEAIRRFKVSIDKNIAHLYNLTEEDIKNINKI